MPTQTTNFALSKPLVNNPTDQDLWGDFLNGDLDELDGLLLTALNWTPTPETSSFNVAAPTTASSATGSAKIIYLCNANSGAVVPTLPAAATASGMTVAFKKTDNGGNAVTVTGHSAETIDGSNTYVLASQYNYVVLTCDGSEWNVISQSSSSTAGLAPLNNPAFTGVPTAPTAIPGTSTGQLATTGFANPAFSAAPNGYLTLPNGIIIQWGNVTGSNSTSNQTVNFPITFTTACFGAWSSLKGPPISGGDVGYMGVASISTSTVVFDYTTTRYWWAIGV